MYEQVTIAINLLCDYLIGKGKAIALLGTNILNKKRYEHTEKKNQVERRRIFKARNTVRDCSSNEVWKLAFPII